MTHADINLLVAGILSHAPDWIRKDLSAKDNAIRTRAEEALATLITAALEKNGLA